MIMTAKIRLFINNILNMIWMMMKLPIALKNNKFIKHFIIMQALIKHPNKQFLNFGLFLVIMINLLLKTYLIS